MRTRLSIQMFTDDKRDTVVALPKALKAIENERWYEGNFIGFQDEPDEILQFSRIEKDEWLVDVPVYTQGKYTNYSMNGVATTALVKQMVRLFFEGGAWNEVVDLMRHRNQSTTNEHLGRSTPRAMPCHEPRRHSRAERLDGSDTARSFTMGI
jgi:hypothetical protein